jgi:hypothetical protein
MGPQGPAGPVGAAGAAGAAGQQGPAGNDGQGVTVTQLAAGNANCPGGGAAVTSASGNAYVCNSSSGGSGVQVQPVIADATTFAKVNAWANLPADHTWTLCYKATRDNINPGFIAYSNYGALQFHAKCDNRGATFFVAKTAGGLLFGGYTAVARSGGSGYCDWRNDAQAFLFSLTNDFKHEQTGYSGYAIYDCASDGVTFGGGNDFFTNLSTDAYVNLGYTYVCRVGDSSSDECANDFAGGRYPSMIELEVYAEQ